MAVIDEIVALKLRCEESFWDVRRAAYALEDATRAAVDAPVEKRAEAEGSMMNAISACVVARLRAGEDARILRYRARDVSLAIADGSVGTETARACAIAVEAAVLAGEMEVECRRAGRAETRAHKTERKGWDK